MSQIITAINKPLQRESDHSMASEMDYHLSDFTLYKGQFEIADMLEKLNNIAIATSIDTKSIIDSFIHAAHSAFWVSYGDWGSFTIPSEEQYPSLMTFESPSRNQHIKYKILQKPLLDRLETLRNKVRGYQPDENIIWPNDQAYMEAKTFICRLPLTEIPEPRLGIAEDGEVNFLWKRKEDGLHVDLGFYGTGTYSYYANNSGKELMEDDVEISWDLPTELVEMLRG